MKKKILSTLIAACLFVGMAVPSVMAVYSSKSGSEDKITTAKFDATNYVVANGDTLNLAEKLTAFCGKTSIAEEPTVEYSLTNNDTKFAFSVEEDGIVSCSEDSGTAKVTVSLNSGKVKTTTTLTAKKAVAKKAATSFTVSTSTKKLPTDNAGAAGLAEDQKLVLKPYPAGSTFVGSDILTDLEAGVSLSSKGEVAFNNDGDKAADAGAFELSTAGAYNAADDVFEITIASGTLITAVADVWDAKALDYTVTTDGGVVKTTKLQAVKAIAANGVGVVKSTIDVEVGKSIDGTTMFKALPSGANVGLGTTIGNDDSDDFAVVIANDNVKGFAVGKSKIACEIGGKVGYATVNVVAAGSVQTATPSAPEKLTVAVGAVAPLAITNAGDATVTWVFDDNGTIGLTNNDKLTTAVVGKKVGTSTIKATMSNGQEFKIVVTVTAAVAPTPGTGTDVPQTGDSLFANLF